MRLGVTAALLALAAAPTVAAPSEFRYISPRFVPPPRSPLFKARPVSVAKRNADRRARKIKARARARRKATR